MLALGFSCVASASARTNLVANGNFSDGLDNWTYVYDWKGQGHYHGNHRLVSVLHSTQGRRSVLCLDGTSQAVIDNQGVKVDSIAIPYDINYEYKLEVTARSEGPGVRVLVEGYGWLPGLRPEGQPGLRDLRRAYKSRTMAFKKGKSPAGAASVGPSWTKGSLTIPAKSMNAMSSRNYTALKRTRFLIVHIVAIAGSSGKVYVSDVKLRQVRKIPPRDKSKR